MEPKVIIPRILSQKEIVSMGGNYHVQHGVLMNIPVKKIDGLDPEPGSWSDDEGNYSDFKPGQKITKPIEVEYNPDLDVYNLWDGNHRVTQAKVNGDKFIKAFVQSDKLQYNKWLNMHRLKENKMEHINKSDLKKLVTETLHKELRKKQLKQRLQEVNMQLQEFGGQEPDYVDDEVEAKTGAAFRAGIVQPENYKVYSMDFDPNETEYDYFQIGVDYSGGVSGKYYPSTLEEPAEHPEIQVNYETWYVKNQETGQWEVMSDDHIVLKADPGIKKTFDSKNRETLERIVADNQVGK